MSLDLPEGALRVQNFLTQKGSDATVRLLPETTATALDAATTLGVPVKHIGKSIVFKSESGEVLVAVVCGNHRVDVKLLAENLKTENFKPVRADDVKSLTGYVIGGVSPFGLPANIKVVVDTHLKEFTHCYVAAGHPKAVVRIAIDELIALTDARVETVVATN
jgi:Cys-tRNA(Pro) deacylase